MDTRKRGSEAIESLAQRFPQLYVAPAEGAQEAHTRASTQGIAPENATLAHFQGSEADELRIVDTPAGPVEVLLLRDRQDFETFLQIIGHKSQPVPIARTVGAITYRGLADWSKVAVAFGEFLARGGEDWGAEFARLAKEPGAFRSELVVISEGPYSNVPASATPYDANEWMNVSREIRLYHECAHVVCRRLMPEGILDVWDEVTADVVGLLCATGGYDVELAARFLGVSETGFCEGRLVEYLTDDQQERLGELAIEVHAALVAIGARADAAAVDRPFDFLIELKRAPLLEY